LNKHKSNKAIDVNAFTLIELIVAIIIVSLTISWALPQFQRRIAQQQTKSFAQTLVSNLYALRARQGADGTGCELGFDGEYNFNNTSKFGTVRDLLDLNHLSVEERGKRLKCCDSAECWIESKADSWKKPYRFLKLEGTAISEEIELQVSANNYELSPPGTSSTAQPFHFLIRSRRWNQDPKRPLKTLCVEISSNGIIRKGSWNGNQNQCGSY
jgi:prepilin-type N-terminal cleavage/methylation domain-containing protein